VNATLISTLVDAVNATQAASHPTPTGQPRPLCGAGSSLLNCAFSVYHRVPSCGIMCHRGFFVLSCTIVTHVRELAHLSRILHVPSCTIVLTWFLRVVSCRIMYHRVPTPFKQVPYSVWLGIGLLRLGRTCTKGLPG
jgi:hypothetical protein